MVKGDVSIEQLNRQEVEAFHTLYKRYYRALVCYAMQWTAAQEPAEDLVQDLFSTIWENHMTFFSLASFQSYLYNSVKNASLNYLKHKEVEQNYAQRVQDEEPVHLPEEDDFFEEELYRQLFQLVDQLPDRCREVFLLYMKGRKNEEIAEALHISTETVKTQKKRAMQFLRKKTGAYSFLLLLTQLP